MVTFENTVVVVRDGFDPAMFKAEEFFGGNVDPGRMIVGPIAEFSYRGGRRCAFSLNTARVDLIARSDEVMPNELEAAAQDLFDTIYSNRTAVTRVGFNCDVALPCQNGINSSNKLANVDLLGVIAAAPIAQVSTSTRYALGGLQ